ncbi:hypothetical protein Shyhy01_32180 [Streptomyces hygroscopicus subsp. hygroscopicus]|nr:hypothetical protein [Streptomyces hygroscopicus]GLX50268.1 hypothetical protein Shyhy01_32180 [Streptomyces hygroscopicus subsp. hygroscopicus]
MTTPAVPAAQLAAPRLAVPAGENGMRHHEPLLAGIAHRAHRAGPAGTGLSRGEALGTVDPREIVRRHGHDVKESP